MPNQELNKRYIILAGIAVVFAASYIFIKLSEWIKSSQDIQIGEREVTVTVPEGFNIKQIGGALEGAGLFKKEVFIAVASREEGFLFPDTYRFYKNASPEDVIYKMKNNFSQKVNQNIIAEAEKQNRTLKDVVTLASILEEEVQTTEDRKIVSGILWKRLANNMGLNVDASLTYVLGKASKDLTQNDLKIDSPYNTYRYRGLPPTPISNPGLDAILAAIRPSSSPYFYYLTDKNGKVHYARTLEDHGLNKYKYLR